MSVETKSAKQAVHDKLEASITRAEAKLDTLKAHAEAAKADAEIKAIAAVATHRIQLHQKFRELRNSSDSNWEHAKKQLETQVAEFEKNVKNIEQNAHVR